ncbi:MAG: UDP-N-acetylglucosamine 1-carboxyvinyltransferase [Clostridia bacterium]|nr:UDP-N-acetylglucosamine 1-carboxyvinyltransferase [Clostridia bacterium]
MQKFWVCGGKPLTGTLRVQGAKNSVLPLLAASLLCGENNVQLLDVPQLSDVTVALEILRQLDCGVWFTEEGLWLDTTRARSARVSARLCCRMRSSILFLGPLLARFGRAELSFPGGCVLGERPIDLHIGALEQMGAVFRFDGENLCATCAALHGAQIHLTYPSVGATENVLMAACLAKGETVLYNRAVEPEIDDLIDFLCRMGADITCYPDCVRVRGVPTLVGCCKAVMPDRIVAYTMLAAALATDGKITLENCPVKSLGTPLEVLAQAGGAVCRRGQCLTARRAGPFVLPVEEIVSGPYPAFPTDDGAVTMALLSLAQGDSHFSETVFSDRFKIVYELRRLGADITVSGQRARIRGVDKLYGNTVTATDLRAGAALLVAALAAEGESVIGGAEYIKRGYETVVANFSELGAQITERSE